MRHFVRELRECSNIVMSPIRLVRIMGFMSASAITVGMRNCIVLFYIGHKAAVYNIL